MSLISSNLPPKLSSLFVIHHCFDSNRRREPVWCIEGMTRGGGESMLTCAWFVRFLSLRFGYRLPLLPDQVCHRLTERKLVSDGLDNVLQFIFTTSEGPFSIPRRNVEVEGIIADRVPGEALFQKPIFVGGQNKEEVADAFSHSIELIASQQKSKPSGSSRLTCKRVVRGILRRRKGKRSRKTRK